MTFRPWIALAGKWKVWQSEALTSLQHNPRQAGLLPHRRAKAPAATFPRMFRKHGESLDPLSKGKI